METCYTPRHWCRSRLSALAVSVRGALRPGWGYREVSILDVLADERGSLPVPSLSSRRARWGACLLVLGALLVLGNLIVCLTRAWAFSGLAVPAVVSVGVGVVMLELSPEAGVRSWWEEPTSTGGDAAGVDGAEVAGSDGPSGVAA